MVMFRIPIINLLYYYISNSYGLNRKKSKYYASRNK